MSQLRGAQGEVSRIAPLLQGVAPEPLTRISYPVIAPRLRSPNKDSAVVVLPDFWSSRRP